MTTAISSKLGHLWQMPPIKTNWIDGWRCLARNKVMALTTSSSTNMNFCWRLMVKSACATFVMGKAA
jgi:hypothetical protein